MIYLKSKATERIGIRVTPELKERLDKRAEEENRTLSNFIIATLTNYLDKVDEAKQLLGNNKKD